MALSSCCENVDKAGFLRDETHMMRRFTLAVFLLATSLAFSACGIVNHQVSRAANLLRVPVRLSDTENQAKERSASIEIQLPADKDGR